MKIFRRTDLDLTTARLKEPPKQKKFIQSRRVFPIDDRDRRQTFPTPTFVGTKQCCESKRADGKRAKRKTLAKFMHHRHALKNFAKRVSVAKAARTVCVVFHEMKITLIGKKTIQARAHIGRSI